MLLIGMIVGATVSKGHSWWIGLLAGLFVAASLYERLRSSPGMGGLPGWMRVGLPLWMGAWIASSTFIFPYFPSPTSWSFALAVGGFGAIGLLGVVILVAGLVVAQRSSRGV
jgi:hypothetical protein